MNKDEIIEKLNTVFCEVFDDDTIRITENTTADDIEDWDSLEHINLLVAVEETFQIKFSMQEVAHLQNVGEMINLISSKLEG